MSNSASLVQRDDDELNYGSDEDEDSIDEEAFNLQDVSSDVEINADELMEEDSDDDELEGCVCLYYHALNNATFLRVLTAICIQPI